MKLSDGEKLILIMLSEIHEKLKIENGVDPKFVKEAIWSGNAWGLKWEYPGIFGSQESSEAVRSEVVDLLDMWSFLEKGFKELSPDEKARVEKEAGPLWKDVRFPGFDGNNETEHLGIAHFLIDQLNRFPDFKGRDLNSHMPSIGTYRRMYAEFEPMRAGLGTRPDVRLTVSEIVKILKAK